MEVSGYGTRIPFIFLKADLWKVSYVSMPIRGAYINIVTLNARRMLSLHIFVT